MGGQCEKCKMREGAEFYFYYGKPKAVDEKGAADSSSDEMINYSVYGPKNVFLCNSCVRKHRLALLLEGIILLFITGFIGVLAIHLGGDSKPVWMMVLAGLIIFCIGIPLMYRSIGALGKALSRSWTGNSLAVEIHMEELKKEGYSKFWVDKPH